MEESTFSIILIAVAVGVIAIGWVIYDEISKKKKSELRQAELDYSDDPILTELRAIKRISQKKEAHLSSIKWTLRVIAFVIGVIMLFGVKLTFQ